MLEEILEGQIRGKPNGIGFDHETQKKQPNKNFACALEDCGMVRKKKEVQDVKFVVASGTYDPTMSKSMLQHPKEHQSYKNKKISRPWICHHCGRYGHIRPYCYKLYGYPQAHVQPKVSCKSVQARKEWKPKTPNVSSSVTSSMSISVPPDLTKSGNLVQYSFKVADVDNTIDKSVYLSSFKNAIAADVASDVTTSLVQPNQIKFVVDSASDNERTQSKKVSDHEDGNTVTIGDEKD